MNRQENTNREHRMCIPTVEDCEIVLPIVYTIVWPENHSAYEITDDEEATAYHVSDGEESGELRVEEEDLD